MPNIKFNYLYRDNSNYKNYGSVVFANPDNVDLSELEALIKSKLDDYTWFHAHEWKLPEIYFSWCDFQNDPTWHEFEFVTYSKMPVNAPISLSEFIDLVKTSDWPWYCQSSR